MRNDIFVYILQGWCSYVFLWIVIMIVTITFVSLFCFLQVQERDKQRAVGMFPETEKGYRDIDKWIEIRLLFFAAHFVLWYGSLWNYRCKLICSLSTICMQSSILVKGTIYKQDNSWYKKDRIFHYPWVFEFKVISVLLKHINIFNSKIIL